MVRAAFFNFAALAQLLAAGRVQGAVDTLHERATAGPIVDLGYGIYQGSYDEASGINSFKGYVQSWYLLRFVVLVWWCAVCASKWPCEGPGTDVCITECVTLHHRWAI